MLQRGKKALAWHLLLTLLCGVAFAQKPGEDIAPPLTGLVPDHAAVSVESLAQEAQWYERVLGFKLYSKFESNPDMLSWHMVIPGYRIDLIKFKGSKRPPKADPVFLQQGWTHIVFHVDDVAAAWRVLQEHHIDISVSKDDKGTPIQLRIRDPEGNEIEIRRNLLL
jgi:catechol 2,3-dioxygenase-like lactoylglutathione lyase family enzyme